MQVAVRYPAKGDVLCSDGFYEGGPCLICFSDASHAPLKTTKRRGISGGILTFNSCVIKTLSRHQQMVSLSSMESELFALQAVAQEMVALGKLVGRVVRNVLDKKLDKPFVPGVLFTDSESSLKLLRNLDTPRRSRHLEIRLEWLKERVSSGALTLSFRKGTNNPADLLTKCLSSSLFEIHRSALGFESLDGPILSIQEVTESSQSQLLFVEVFVEGCCRESSMLMVLARSMGFAYLGVHDDMTQDKTFVHVRNKIARLNIKRVWVHVSVPSSSGLTLNSFGTQTEALKPEQEWSVVAPKVLCYLKLGIHSSFELPWYSCVWEQEITKQTLKQAGHSFFVKVHVCQTGAKALDGRSIGKSLCFTTTSPVFSQGLHAIFGVCKCQEPHTVFSGVRWFFTAFYNKKLAKEVLSLAKSTLLQS